MAGDQQPSNIIVLFGFGAIGKQIFAQYCHTLKTLEEQGKKTNHLPKLAILVPPGGKTIEQLYKGISLDSDNPLANTPGILVKWHKDDSIIHPASFEMFIPLQKIDLYYSDTEKKHDSKYPDIKPLSALPKHVSTIITTCQAPQLGSALPALRYIVESSTHKNVNVCLTQNGIAPWIPLYLIKRGYNQAISLTIDPKDEIKNFLCESKVYPVPMIVRMASTQSATRPISTAGNHRSKQYVPFVLGGVEGVTRSSCSIDAVAQFLDAIGYTFEKPSDLMPDIMAKLAVNATMGPLEILVSAFLLHAEKTERKESAKAHKITYGDILDPTNSDLLKKAEPELLENLGKILKILYGEIQQFSSKIRNEQSNSVHDNDPNKIYSNYEQLISNWSTKLKHYAASVFQTWLRQINDPATRHIQTESDHLIHAVDQIADSLGLHYPAIKTLKKHLTTVHKRDYLKIEDFCSSLVEDFRECVEQHIDFNGEDINIRSRSVSEPVDIILSFPPSRNVTRSSSFPRPFVHSAPPLVSNSQNFSPKYTYSIEYPSKEYSDTATAENTFHGKGLKHESRADYSPRANHSPRYDLSYLRPLYNIKIKFAMLPVEANHLEQHYRTTIYLEPAPLATPPIQSNGFVEKPPSMSPKRVIHAIESLKDIFVQGHEDLIVSPANIKGIKIKQHAFEVIDEIFLAGFKATNVDDLNIETPDHFLYFKMLYSISNKTEKTVSIKIDRQLSEPQKQHFRALYVQYSSLVCNGESIVTFYNLNRAHLSPAKAIIEVRDKANFSWISHATQLSSNPRVSYTRCGDRR
ncbi:MAG: hypothetical protein IPP74_09805 [Alphaproteobacteria bacterium]|nr:hypothetical protein [Alphaproteobacteria bacterium]